MMMKKHFSSIANDVLQRCSQTLGTSVDSLVEEFELGLLPETSDYSRKLVEFCSSRALSEACRGMEEEISDGPSSFSRFTFDMMLAWENPSCVDDDTYLERVAKEKEDRKIHLQGEVGSEHDDISLFYSDLMPLLVTEEPTVGEDAFVWLSSLLPLIADVTNARFTFEALTAPTANRLHFPAYDRLLKEIDKCIKYLQRQSSPTGVALAEDEFILHVEGTARTQRVVRHIGQTSWPGRLTLTNRALYFEASKAVSYEDALKLDLSRPDVNHRVNAGSTGPWGAPLFDKAMIYESTQLSEPVVLEFPELTGSTRRDHWLALTKEVIFLHRFLSKFQIEPPLRAWEVQARTILGIFRLHAAREMLRISPPVPSSFLIFYLFDKLPKGDYVLEELSNSLGGTDAMHPCSATLILKRLNISHRVVEDAEVKEGLEGPAGGVAESLVSLETTIGQAREEAKELVVAKASIEGLKEEGIAYSLLILMELLSPLNHVLPWFQRILSWENPLITLVVLALSMLITYKEWIGYALATFLLFGVIEMLRARLKKMAEKCKEIVVSTSSEQTTMESIVSAQHGLNNFHAAVQKANIAILKIRSIVVSRAPKHANSVMLAMAGAAVLLMVVPFKYVVLATTLLFFASNSKAGKSMSDEQSNRRLREWWDSIPVIPVRIVSDGMTS